MTKPTTIEEVRALVADGMLRVKEAASFSGYSRNRLFGLIAAGELPSMLLGKHRLISRRALEQLMADDLAKQMGII